MHKSKIVSAITVALGVASLVCLVGYFLALHDISQDYASPKVLRDHAGIAADILPRWTTCDLEWAVIYLGFLPMLIFHVLFFVNRFWRTKRSLDGSNPIHK